MSEPNTELLANMPNIPATSRHWLLARRPKGLVSTDDFSLAEQPIPEVADGSALARICYLTFEPAMRGWMDDVVSYMPPVELGEPMRAPGMAVVVESKHPDFAPGDLVFGMMSWSEYVTHHAGWSKVPSGVDPELVLGPAGGTGLTAYFGLLDVGQPQAGETVVVSGAAGATGSVAAQIARIKGCRVIGIAGGEEKCRWLLEQARLDAAIDYKSENVAARLKALCPDGIDVFFDNVGGSILEAVLNNLAMDARIALCGMISTYNDATPQSGPANLFQLIVRRGTLQGFMVFDYMDRRDQALADLFNWVAAGEIAFRTDVQHGFENIPTTFLRLFDGSNQGKQVLKVSDTDL